MPEFPDANAGGLDPQAGGLDPLSGQKPKPPLWKRVRAWTIIGALYSLFLGMAAAAIPLLRAAFRPGVALDDRLLHLLEAGCLLAPLGFVVRYFVRVRLKTGQWRGTPEQRQQERQQRQALCSVRGGKRACAAKYRSPVSYAVKWASCMAFASESAPWQRAAAWLVLAGYTLVELALTAFGAIMVGAGMGTLSKGGAWILLFGLVILYLPASAIYRLVRGFSEGKVGTTPEELEEIRALRTAWATREQQKPLRNKLVSVGFLVVFYGLWTAHAILHPTKKDPSGGWVRLAMSAPVVLYGIWVQFRKPKSAPPAADN